jgi:hypothetical protein
MSNKKEERIYRLIDFYKHTKDIFNWDFERIQLSPGITKDDILNNLHLPWKYKQLAWRSDLDMEFVEHVAHITDPDFRRIDYLYKSTLETQVDNIGSSMELERLLLSGIQHFQEHDQGKLFTLASGSKYMTIKILRKFKAQFDHAWTKSLLTLNEAFTIDEIIDTWNEFGWCIYNVMENPNFEFEDLEKLEQLKDIKFYHKTFWRRMTTCPKITCKHIEQTPHYLWDYTFLVYNPNLTVDFLVKHMDFIFDDSAHAHKWSMICQNANIQMNDLETHPTLPWRTIDLSRNPNLTFEYVLNHLDKQWDPYFFCMNSWTHMRKQLTQATIHTATRTLSVLPNDLRQTILSYL